MTSEVKSWRDREPGSPEYEAGAREEAKQRYMERYDVSSEEHDRIAADPTLARPPAPEEPEGPREPTPADIAAALAAGEEVAVGEPEPEPEPVSGNFGGTN